jgi:hypothetical protein
MPEGDRKGRSQLSITYNPARYASQNEIKPDRSTLVFTVTDQTGRQYNTPETGKALLRVKVTGLSGYTPGVHLPISLVQLSNAMRFVQRTDSYGMAEFMIPSGLEYEVDIDGIQDYAHISIPKRSGFEMGYGLRYEPTNIKETVRNDTIIQQVPESTKDGTSARVFTTIVVKNAKDAENVYLNELKGTSVYWARTNKLGVALFMLPLGKKYMIHFDFQRDVDVVDLTQTTGIGKYEKRLSYNPDPRLQYPLQYIPTPDRLLLNDFNDFLKRQLPEPEGDRKIDFFAHWGNGINANSKEALLEIGFTTMRGDKLRRMGSPVNVSFVIDKSGSMAGYERIETLRDALASFVDKIRPDDYVSIVSFDTETKLLLPAAKKIDAKNIKSIIQGIEASGGTYMYDAMVLGYEQLLLHYSPKGTNRLILLTDGYDTSEVNVIVGKSKEYNAKGLELSAVGVGTDYNQSLLSLLATEGGGLLHFTGTAGGISDVFAQELESIVRPVAKEATFEILYNKRIVFKELYGFPVESVGAEKAVIRMKNLYGGLNKIALVKFDLHKPSPEILSQPVVLRLKYIDAETDKQVTVEKNAALIWNDYTGIPELVVEQEQKKLYAIATMNQTLKVMAQAVEAKNNTKARQVLVSTYTQMRNLFPKATDEDVRKLMESIDRYIHAFDMQQQNETLKKKQ